MFSSFFHSRSRRTQTRRAPSSSVDYGRPVSEHDRLLGQRELANAEDNVDEDAEENEDSAESDEFDRDEFDEEDDLEDPSTALPLFSAAHLDAIPVYSLTHSVRTLIVQKCETTLSWDQLRSPQISQFLVKPIETKIKASDFSRATLYALVANCLQFQKEAQLNPAIIGICKTRALLAELLAVRLLREYSARELIDALSYDFDPLSQAQIPIETNQRKSSLGTARSARTSTLEVAIRAQAKRFLAHPVVVRHLEAIWAGAIVFHNSADGLHRYPSKPKANNSRHYGATHANGPANAASASEPGKDMSAIGLHGEAIRRSVTLYNPRYASLFKLSRLRVPRYRQLFSMLSYAIMLGLFLAVLAKRNPEITALEMIFWLWSAGFMLDEIVGFSEQGFGLYIMSVWNAFDIGILLFFLAYYLLRLYGIIVGANEDSGITAVAYDILASSAVLLFPRMFSVLDHYKYFSQLLVAFRLMAQDLVAVLLLIVISCSGFFVAFTMSMNGDRPASSVVYQLFQMLMGFTPTAWELWDDSNVLGRAVLVLFLFIAHFLVITILITVLTNGFMSVVSNAEEEHQFLFAINAMSMVKSDALFSYIAPSNLVGWFCSPLRHVMPFKTFVRFNRTLIKVTHLGVLLLIFGYERFCLSPYAFDPAEPVERRGRTPRRRPVISLSGVGNQGPSIFSPGLQLREPSATTYFKDRALDEVFRRPYVDSIKSRQTSRQPVQQSTERRTSVVDDWISGLGHQGGASSPMEQPRSILEHLEGTRRPALVRSNTAFATGTLKRQTSMASRSIISDPEDYPGTLRRHQGQRKKESFVGARRVDLSDESDESQDEGDGDDELLENEDEEDDRDTTTLQQHDSDKENDLIAGSAHRRGKARRIPAINMQRRLTKVMEMSPDETSETAQKLSSLQRARGHARNASTNTILFRPLEQRQDSPASSSKASPKQRKMSSRPGTAFRSTPPSAQTLRRASTTVKPRPILYNRSAPQRVSAPNVQRLLDLSSREARRQPSFDTLALDLASDIGDNREAAGNIMSIENALGGSFQSNFFDTIKRRQGQSQGQGRGGKRWNGRNEGESGQSSEVMGRLVLARMNTLEEGFKDILKEVKEWRSADASRVESAQGSGNDAA